jgi:hypothetical protein
MAYSLLNPLARPTPKAAPIIWARIKAGVDSSAMPVNESVKLREIVIAGFANEVDEVKRIAPNIQSGT